MYICMYVSLNNQYHIWWLYKKWKKFNPKCFGNIILIRKGRTIIFLQRAYKLLLRNDSDGLTERLESRTIKRFGEIVCLLVVRVNEFKTYDFILHQITNEVIVNLYVLGLWVLKRILGKIYGISVVTKHTQHFLRNLIVMKKFLHPKKLSTTTPSSYILSFSCR